MAEKTKQPSEFFNLMNRRVFERVIRGDHDYDKDMQITEKYLEQAKKLNDPELEANIVNTRAVLNAFSGYLDRATELFWDLLALNERGDNLSGMGRSYNNLAVTSEIKGDSQQALYLYNQGLALFNHPDDSLLEYGRLMTGRFNTLVILGEYDEADVCFDQINRIRDSLVAHNRAEYARMMVKVYRYAAEMALHRDQIEHATKYTNLALDFAQGLNLTIELAMVHFTESHLALNANQSPEPNWEKAKCVLQNIVAPALIGRAYIQEARHLQNMGYVDEARDFTLLALQLFEDLNLEDDIKIANSLLA